MPEMVQEKEQSSCTGVQLAEVTVGLAVEAVAGSEWKRPK